MPLLSVLSAMEQEGIAIDSDGLIKYSEELGTTLVDLESSIKEEAGMDFNVDSPRQLGQVLFDHMQIS